MMCLVQYNKNNTVLSLKYFIINPFRNSVTVSRRRAESSRRRDRIAFEDGIDSIQEAIRGGRRSRRSVSIGGGGGVGSRRGDAIIRYRRRGRRDERRQHHRPRRRQQPVRRALAPVRHLCHHVLPLGAISLPLVVYHNLVLDVAAQVEFESTFLKPGGHI
jgi:hypothetical protein